MLKENIIYFDEKKSYVKFKPLNGKDLGIYTHFVYPLKENIINGEIVDVCSPFGEIILSKGKNINIQLPISNNEYFESKYPINFIHKNLEKKYDYIASVEENTKTTNYLLPCLTQNQSFFSTHEYLINAYISKDKKFLLVRYRFSTSDKYGRLEEELKKHGQYFDFIDVDEFSVIYRFKIPKEFHEDIELFLQGKYSHLSGTLKNRIRMFHNYTMKNKIMQILYKSEDLRKSIEKNLGMSIEQNSELESKPDIKFEVWQKEL